MRSIYIHWTLGALDQGTSVFRSHPYSCGVVWPQTHLDREWICQFRFLLISLFSSEEDNDNYRGERLSEKLAYALHASDCTALEVQQFAYALKMEAAEKVGYVESICCHKKPI